MRFYLIVVLALVVFKLSGQEASYALSNEIVMRNSDEFQGLIRSDSSGYTLHIYERNGKGLLDYPGRNLILEKYDKNFNQVFSYSYGDETKDPMISIELVSIGDHYIWIVMEKIREYKYEYSMIPIGLDGKLGEKEFLFNNTVEKYGDLPQTYTRLSPDSSKMVFVATFDDDRKKESTEIFATVINDKAQILWDKFTALRGNQKQYQIKDYQLSNEGEVYFVAKTYKDAKAKEKVKGRGNREVAGYDVIVYKVRGGKKMSLQKSKVELKGAFISDVKLLPHSDGKIFCSGLTTSKSKNNINGLFYANVDSKLNITNLQTRPFTTKELIRLSRGEADVNLKGKDKQGLDNDFKLTDLFFAADSSIFLVAEQNYSRNFVDYDNGFGTSFRNSGINNSNNSLTFYSNDIIVIELGKGNELLSLDHISKKQNASIYYRNSFYNISEERERRLNYLLSYSYMLEDGSPIFLYNDHEDNLDLERSRKKVINNPRDMTSVFAFRSQEDYELDYALPGLEKNLILSPTRCKQISDKEFFFTAIQSSSSSGSVVRIGVLEFN